MDNEILKHFEMKLLWENRRIMTNEGIKDIYVQPDRLNPEDAIKSVCDSRNSENK